MPCSTRAAATRCQVLLSDVRPCSRMARREEVESPQVVAAKGILVVLYYFDQIDSHASRTPLSITNFGQGHASLGPLSNFQAVTQAPKLPMSSPYLGARTIRRARIRSLTGRPWGRLMRSSRPSREISEMRPNQLYQEIMHEIRVILQPKFSQKPQLGSSHPIDTDLKFIMCLSVLYAP
ncbi:Peptidase C14 [Mycena venus]|uniref:Peptidase C14 n=1 Tax=Mycena venus TaxID=2733690 RepID=A0A8H6YRD7_9AGAR|nr:Peptidase C14 [Mycena venus]